MVTVQDLLSKKPDQLWTIPSGATVYEALEKLAEKDVGALPVIDDGKLVGIFSERDYARNVVLKGRSSRDMPVSELMVRNVCCVRKDQTIEDCMSLMTHKRCRHLPVIEDNRVVAMVTIGDVVKQVISDQQDTIEHLENYIQGNL